MEREQDVEEMVIILSKKKSDLVSAVKEEGWLGHNHASQIINNETHFYLERLGYKWNGENFEGLSEENYNCVRGVVAEAFANVLETHIFD